MILSAVLSTKIQSVVSTGKGWHRHYSALTTTNFYHSFTYLIQLRILSIQPSHHKKDFCVCARTKEHVYHYMPRILFGLYVPCHSYKCKFRVISQYKIPCVSVSNILSNFEQGCRIDIVFWIRSKFTISILNIW